jgi:hypothetical protein
MQKHYHSPIDLAIPIPTYHPIFHRIKERSTPSSPIADNASEVSEIIWEKRFLKCSYAMVSSSQSLFQGLADRGIVLWPLFIFGIIILPTDQTPDNALLDYTLDRSVADCGSSDTRTAGILQSGQEVW